MVSSRLLPWLAMMLVLVTLSKADFDKDKQQCAETLAGLATCLPYVTGGAKAPTMDCCSSLKPVLDKNNVCLCILIKDRDDPKLGLKLNATLALGLPGSCHLPSNITDCPRLMKLPPNSPEAKIFEDYGRNVQKNNSTIGTQSGGGSSSSGIKNDGGRRHNWLGVEKFWSSLYIIIMVLFQMA